MKKEKRLRRGVAASEAGIKPEIASQDEGMPPVGVVWKFIDKVIDGKTYRVLETPSNDTSTAIQYYWRRLSSEAHQVVASGQTRTFPVVVIQRNFETISKCATESEIQELLDACSGVKPKRFPINKWVGRVLNARTGVAIKTMERFRRFHGTRQKKPRRASSR
jgi:hypothetical protein